MLKYCLHHVELAYARGDCWQKRKAALKEWETFCNSKKAPKSNDLTRCVSSVTSRRQRATRPPADDFATLWLCLLALLPQIGGVLLMDAHGGRRHG